MKDFLLRLVNFKDGLEKWKGFPYPPNKGYWVYVFPRFSPIRLSMMTGPVDEQPRILQTGHLKKINTNKLILIRDVNVN